MKPTLFLQLIIVLALVIGLISPAHSLSATVPPFEQPFAYVTHTGVAFNDLSIVNLKTKNITGINSTFGAPLKTALINDRGTRAYLIFQNGAGIFVEAWDLVKKKKILGPTTNLFSTDSNYQFLLGNNGQTIVVAGYVQASNQWFLHYIDTATLNVSGGAVLVGNGSNGRITLSTDQQKVYSAIGPQFNAVTEVNLVTGAIKSIPMLLSNAQDIVTTNVGPVTTHVPANSQVELYDFTGTTPATSTQSIAVAGPPQINASPDGTRIVFLPDTQEYKGGSLINFVHTCSFNSSTLKWKPYIDIGNSGNGYTITDINQIAGTIKLTKLNTNTCASTFLMNVANAPYVKSKTKISVTPKEDFVVTIEGNNLHVFDLNSLTESILNIGPTSTVVTRSHVKAISMP